MKVLWIVNNPLAVIRNELGLSNGYGGGWLDGLLKYMEPMEEVELSIASPYDTDRIRKIEKNGTAFYLVPGGYKSRDAYSSCYDAAWDEVVNQLVQPDLIHIHGTEFAHVLNVIKVSGGIKKVVSIQGLISEYWKYYYYGVDRRELRRSLTLKDYLRGTSVKSQQEKMRLQSLNEIEIIKSVDYIFGRTEWDRIHTNLINEKAQYLYAGEILRESFYGAEKWRPSQCVKNRILVSQATYPIKGLHILIDALGIMKKRGYEFELCIAGTSIFNGDFRNNIKDSNYARYLKKQIRRNKLENMITILGILDEQEMVQELLKANVFVCSSAIENSPNSVGEAMLLGVPLLASFVGGIPSMLKDSRQLYDGVDSGVLAGKLIEVLEDEALQIAYSQSEIAEANERFDGDMIVSALLKRYEEIYSAE